MARIALFLLLLVTVRVQSQSQLKTPDALQISGSWSTHGTGDLSGYMVEVAHDHSFNRRFDLTNAIAFTTHYLDSDYAYVLTSGIQISSMINFNFLHPIATAPQKIRLGVGPIFRYEQSPFASYNYKVYTVGYQVAVGYLAQLGKKFQLGFKVGFQNDTDGAVITRVGLVIGRYVKFTENDKKS